METYEFAQTRDFSSSVHNSSQNDLRIFIKFFLPTASGINIPLVLTNLIVFINTGILNSPSNILYFNLVIMDLLNCIVGIMLSYHMHITNTSAKVGHSTLETVFYTIYNFAYNGRVFLVFGLCLIRVLWTEMSALSVISQLKKISVVTVMIAYFMSVSYLVYRLYEISRNPEEGSQLFTSGLAEAGELFVVGLIISIILMSIYIQVRIRLNKSRLQNNSRYKRASKVSLLITLLFAISYSYYAVHLAAKIYLKKHWENIISQKCGSPTKDVNPIWIDILVCNSLRFGVSFMCIQSLGNGIILLWQVPTNLAELELKNEMIESTSILCMFNALKEFLLL